ncbi:MAG: hypothetical protein HFI47_00600 [Lachnospiraceae bacterium]|jgi:hypothetical protein|nr:hypothetical protein [Lachnospiraceae bacterium]
MSTFAKTEIAAQAGQAYEASSASAKKPGNYGRTIGRPELSEKAEEYYKELKKKFSNMDFILVSKDMKDMARASAASYANPNRLVVLIDEEKLERMVQDESFRKQYEGIIRSAGTKLPQLKQSLGSNASLVKGFGMEINKKGIASFFAVVDKSLAAQKKRIANKAKEKKANARKEEKKAAKKAQEEKWEEMRAGKDEDLVTVTASSIEELIQKINDVVYSSMSDYVQTEDERMVGQHFDSRW